MKNILLNGFIGLGINGSDEVVLETNDSFDLNDKFITITAINHEYDKYKNSKWHGTRKYTINTSHIVCVWDDEIIEQVDFETEFD